MSYEKNPEKRTVFCELYDIIGSSEATNEQRETAWQKLLPIENIIGLAILIAAKYSWREIPAEYKEKAWKELLKKGIRKNLVLLNYLSSNAPEPWSGRSRNLKEKLLEALERIKVEK